MERRTHIVIIVQVQGSCNVKTLYRWMKKRLIADGYSAMFARAALLVIVDRES